MHHSPRFALSAAVLTTAFILLAPLAVSAQSVTTYSTGSPANIFAGGGILITSPYGGLAGQLDSPQLLSILTEVPTIAADFARSGITPSSNPTSPVDGGTNNIGLNIDVANAPTANNTANRLCYDLDAYIGGPNPSALTSGYTTIQPADTSGNYGLAYCPTASTPGICTQAADSGIYSSFPTWIWEWADSSKPQPSGDAGYATTLSCTSYTLPSQTLTASTYDIATPGQSVTLTWGDTAWRDTVWLPVQSPAEPAASDEADFDGHYLDPAGPLTTCTMSTSPASPAPPGFSITPTSGAVCRSWVSCADQSGASGCSVSGHGQDGCALATTNSFPEPTSGSTTVYPLVTTTYNYVCTNPNGTATSSATVTVSPASCTLPWGGTIPSGSSVTTYQAPSVTAPAACVSQTRTCTNGVLSGTYTNQACTVNPAQLADLTAGAITPTAASAGTATSFLATVSNIGAATTGAAFPVLFQAATDAAGDGATNLGTSNAATLAASSSEQSSFSYAPTSTFYMRACANTTNNSTFSVTESNYSNNCGAWTQVTVSPAPAADLIVTGAISPATAGAGTVTTFSATVKNQGTAATSAAFPVLYQDATSAAGAGAANIGTDSSAAALAAGASETSTMDTGVSLTAGTWYVRACANTTNNSTFSVTESNYSNNCGAWTQVTVVATPTCTLSASGANTNLTLNWTTQNALSASINQGIGSVSPTVSGSTAVTYPSANTTYTMTVSGPGGTGTCATVVVSPGPPGSPDCTAAGGCGPGCSTPGTCGGSYPPVCTNACCGPASVCNTPATITSFSPNPSSVVCGNSTLLTWTSSNATSCTGTGFTTTAANNTSGVSVTPTNIPTTNYSLTCTGAGGTSAPQNTSVTVVVPNATIQVSPVRVASGGKVTVTWDATDVKSCIVSANGTTIASGTANGSGEYTDSASPYTASTTAQTVYAISCTLASGAPQVCVNAANDQSTATVNVLPTIQNF